jgi:acetyltransferase-like isoleucine patch superfamily enzyme
MHVILNVHSAVFHDSVINAFVNIESGVSIGRRVTLGTGCSIGAGATVTDDVQVGEWSVIGAGAVVEDNVPAHVTVTGAPARIVQRHGRAMRHSRLAG